MKKLGEPCTFDLECESVECGRIGDLYNARYGCVPKIDRYAWGK